jgi:1,2-diacylglycerol 3-beta-glucosyltransferase
VLERDEPAARGKGHALAWALARPEVLVGGDVAVVVDADCEVSPNLLAAIDRRIAEGAQAVQVSYGVANADAAPAAALRHAAFALVNHVRPLGRSRLGCSAGLLGTGFALTRGLLERAPWDAVTLAEDREYHARLVLAGERVAFAPEACVLSEMPLTTAAARGQNLRWEAGRRSVARRFAAPLARAGWRRRDAAALEAALECVVPPQSVLAAANAAATALAVALRARGAVLLGACNLAAQALYVIGGLAVARAPRSVYVALLGAPRLALWKLGLQLRLLARRGPREWVGTRQAAA